MKVGLIGYYHYGNYGDELFNVIFRKALSEYEIVYLQDIMRRPFYLENLADKVAKVDFLVIGGGDLVIPYYWTDQYFEEVFLRKPIFMHGIGVPTWGGLDEKIVARLKRFFQHESVKYINVRDLESKLWIESNLSPNVPVTFTADMVCSLPFEAVAARAGKPVFGLISREQKKSEFNWANIRALLRRAEDLGYTIKHIVAATGPIGEQDRASAREFDMPGVQLCASEYIDDITSEIASCRFVASMKFHGCVVATMLGIPALSLITTDKFRNFYTMIERPDLIGHHTHKNLADRLPNYPVPIPRHTRDILKNEARSGLDGLARAIRSTMAGAAT